jgi:hypothetical protein
MNDRAIFKAKTSAPPRGHHQQSRGRGKDQRNGRKSLMNCPGRESEGRIKNAERNLARLENKNAAARFFPFASLARTR